MKSIQLLCFLLGLLIIVSCKQNATTEQEDKSQDTTKMITTTSPEATNISGGHDYTFLTQHILIYDASLTVGKDPKDDPYKGQWIDLMPDGTFKAGKLKNQTHTGRWDYNHDIQTLQLKPDDSKFKTSEWKVMHNENMLVWVGTQTHGDNATQIKLVRREQLPE